MIDEINGERRNERILGLFVAFTFSHLPLLFIYLFTYLCIYSVIYWALITIWPSARYIHKKIGNANAMEEQSGTRQYKNVFCMLSQFRISSRKIKKSLAVSWMIWHHFVCVYVEL